MYKGQIFKANTLGCPIFLALADIVVYWAFAVSVRLERTVGGVI